LNKDENERRWRRGDVGEEGGFFEIDEFFATTGHLLQTTRFSIYFASDWVCCSMV
jgi:hypothetical protein